MWSYRNTGRQPGGEEPDGAKKELMQVARQVSVKAIRSLPAKKLKAHTAAGISGERPEHLNACVIAHGKATCRRVRAALDQLMIGYAVGDLPDSCRLLEDL